MCVCVSTDGEDRTFLRQKSPHFDFCDFDFFKTRFFFRFSPFFLKWCFCGFSPSFFRAKTVQNTLKIPQVRPARGINALIPIFQKKPFFWVKKGQDPEQSMDLETMIKMPCGTPKNTQYSAKILQQEFRTSGGARWQGALGYECQNFQHVSTGDPVHIKHIFIEVPKILNEFSRE